MTNYYLTLVFKPELDEKDRQGLIDQIKKRVTGTDGEIAKEDLWGNRDLAYPIKKNLKGFYAHFEVKTDPSNMKGIDKILRVEEDILRYLVVKKG